MSAALSGYSLAPSAGWRRCSLAPPSRRIVAALSDRSEERSCLLFGHDAQDRARARSANLVLPQRGTVRALASHRVASTRDASTRVAGRARGCEAQAGPRARLRRRPRSDRAARSLPRAPARGFGCVPGRANRRRRARVRRSPRATRRDTSATACSSASGVVSRSTVELEYVNVEGIYAPA